MLFSGNKKKIKKMTFQLFWLVIFISNFCIFNLEAQSKKSDKIVFDTCETILEGLRSVAYDFQKKATPDSYLLIIGGAMKGEKSSYNSRRIQEAIGYLDFAGSIKSNRIVFGSGRTETEAGYLRLYVNGILSTEIRTRKNAKLCWGEGNELKFSTGDVKK